MNRASLSDTVIDRIRQERIRPRPTQWDYLHLRGLLQGLQSTFARLAHHRGPILDLYCGTQPYRELMPWSQVIGLDRDYHFGRADLLGTLPLPFRDGVFSVVVCTQALYLVDDPEATISEIRRVLAIDGHAVISVPYLFRREIAAERRYSATILRSLFDGWDDVRVTGVGGPGTGLAYVPGSLMGAAVRRIPPLRFAMPALSLALNGVAVLVEATTRPLAGRWPGSLILTARKPAGGAEAVASR